MIVVSRESGVFLETVDGIGGLLRSVLEIDSVRGVVVREVLDG